MRTILINHYGNSMHPTIKEGDILSVSPVDPASLQPGDVIIYTVGKIAGKNKHAVTHRIVSVREKGLVTRGDNNLSADGTIVPFDRVVGRAEWVKRGTVLRRVKGGRAGRNTAFLLAVKLRIQKGVLKLIKPAVFFFFGFKAVRRTTSILMGFGLGRAAAHGEYRVYRYENKNGVRLTLFLGNRVIGTFEPNAKRWKVKQPYRLFIDDSNLPVTETEKSALRDPAL